MHCIEMLFNGVTNMITKLGTIYSLVGRPNNQPILGLPTIIICDTHTWACPSTKFRLFEYAPKSQTASIFLLLSRLSLGSTASYK